jgi:hypothetical protein
MSTNLQFFKIPQTGIETIRSKLAMKIYDEYVNILEMKFSHYSVFLVPCIPFLCSIGSMCLVPVCWFVSSFIGFVRRIVCLSILLSLRAT